MTVTISRSLIVFAVALVATITAVYPTAATSIVKVWSGHGWDGSGLRYYQEVFVTPAAVIFTILSLAIFWVVGRLNRAIQLICGAVAVLLAISFVAVSIIWYSAQIP